ncbi:MAG: hypothetical protein RXR43_08415 [Sulfolobus sp.]
MIRTKKILFLSIVLIGIIVITISSVTLLKASNSSADINTLNPKILGKVYIYNVSYLLTFANNYINTSSISNISSAIGEGVIYSIELNNTRAITGYIQLIGPEASAIFYEINSTLVKHGFKQGSYHNLIYYYKYKTVIGFDGKFLYFTHTNSSTNEAINITIYEYESNKILPTPVKGIIAEGYYKSLNITMYYKDGNIVLNFTGKANFTEIERMLKFILFETNNLTVEGNVVYSSSDAIVYSLNITYYNEELYVMSGISEGVKGVIIISSQPISISEVLDLL